MDDSLNQYREAFINESREMVVNLNRTLLELEKAPENTAVINEAFRFMHNLKGMAATMGFEKITKLSHELENVLDVVRTGKKKISGEIIAVLFKGADWLDTMISGLEKRSEGVYNLAPIYESISKVMFSKDNTAPIPGSNVHTATKAEPLVPGIDFTKPSSLRVDTKILDDLINQIGELVISKNRLQDVITNCGSSDISDAFYYSNKIITTLENTVLKTRIVPADYLFNRFPRMVRDLAREQKKEVNFIVEGKDIGLDRGILDELNDPLVHTLRNAVYHGIETASARKKAHKSAAGKITLSAKKEENFISIVIEDDGGGIDVERVKEVAVKKGLIKKAEASVLYDNEVYNLLCLPGFSTVETADKTSGRGVGLDVVKTKVESLNGVFTIESKRGIGSKFIMKVPLTLAIIQALIVDIYGETYALPFSAVKEAFAVNSANKNGSIDYKGKKIPFVKLKEVLEIPETKTSSVEALIIDFKGKEIGLEISKIKSQHEIVVKPLSKPLKPDRIFSGASILGNGEVVLILDLNTIANEMTKTGASK